VRAFVQAAGQRQRPGSAVVGDGDGNQLALIVKLNDIAGAGRPLQSQGLSGVGVGEGERGHDG
jgi:hypothetical protein